MLEEVGLPYTVRLVDITGGEQFSPDFLTISPNNKIPTLIDSDEAGERRILFESGAILIYQAEKTGLFWRPEVSSAPKLFRGSSGPRPASPYDRQVPAAPLDTDQRVRR